MRSCNVCLIFICKCIKSHSLFQRSFLSTHYALAHLLDSTSVFEQSYNYVLFFVFVYAGLRRASELARCLMMSGWQLADVMTGVSFRHLLALPYLY